LPEPNAGDTSVAATATSLSNAKSDAKSAEYRWMLRVALFTMALTLLPYLIGWSFAQGRQFMWLGYNLDDSCVYLSWMRQAADGSLRALNLFTTDPQHGMLLNPLFLGMGWLARLTGLPLIAVYHGCRLLFGFGLLVVVWKFICLTIADTGARRFAFLCVCFASGVGWLPLPWDALPTSPTCPPGPIDYWQPEAVTFLSLYLSPLFCFSMLLQVAILTLLFQGERTGKINYAVGAGICGFVLGLVHTYDILSLSAVWVVYLVVERIRRHFADEQITDEPVVDRHEVPTKSAGIGSFLRAGLAGLITLPAVAYIYHALQTEATFQKRANVETLSALPFWIALGYGGTLVLAIYAACILFRKSRQGADRGDTTVPSRECVWTTGRSAATLLVTWAVMNVLVSYLPASKFPFQRKMLQGAHFPIAMLAGIGLAYLLSLPSVHRQIHGFRFTGGIIVLLLGLTNIKFVVRDLGNYRDNRAQTMQQRPFLNPGEIDALEWIRKNAPADAAIQPLPWVVVGGGKIGVADMSLACFAPGLTHHPVYCGHWGETPDYVTADGRGKLMELVRFMRPNFPDSDRINLLRKMKVQYVIFSQKESLSSESSFVPFLGDPLSVPFYLSRVYSNKDADVFKVELPTQTEERANP
jgi:hypothetical protein